MSNYAESKKKIDNLRGRHDEPMFRMAISHLMDVGIRHLTEANVKETCEQIMKEDDSKAFMTNHYRCDLVWLAYDLAQIPHIDLLVYIQREVEYDVFDGGITYPRAVKLLKNYTDWALYECHNRERVVKQIQDIGIEEDDIIQLGYGHMLNTFYTREEE